MGNRRREGAGQSFRRRNGFKDCCKTEKSVRGNGLFCVEKREEGVIRKIHNFDKSKKISRNYLKFLRGGGVMISIRINGKNWEIFVVL